MTNEHQRKVIRSLKGLEEGYFAKEIPVINDRNITIGSLRPIDNKLSNNEVIISSLTRWRQMFMCYFFTQFEATNERTRTWLNNIVIKDDTRILFLITDKTNRAIGNFGVCNISGDSAELDNLIRGEIGGDRKLVYYSELSLIYWIFKSLEVNTLYFRLFTNNFRAIRLHESVGAVCRSVNRVIKKRNNEEIHYILDSSSAPLRDELGLMKMTLDKHEFLSKHSWLGE